MSSKANDPRGKKKLGERSAEERSSSSRVGNANSSSSISGVSAAGSRTSSNSGSEEWFDASEGLPDYSSDDDARRNLSSDPGPSSRGDSGLNTMMLLKAEIQRRIAAEDARESLQHQRDEKSKEIARLKDKLQYYVLVNHGMSQRNQESIENARQRRRRRQRIQRFVVFGLSAAICAGVSVAAVCHYAHWEHVKEVSDMSVLQEGEQSNPVSLEQVVDLKDLKPDHSTLILRNQ